MRGSVTTRIERMEHVLSAAMGDCPTCHGYRSRVVMQRTGAAFDPESLRCPACGRVPGQVQRVVLRHRQGDPLPPVPSRELACPRA
jgi:hypothetical protein